MPFVLTRNHLLFATLSAAALAGAGVLAWSSGSKKIDPPTESPQPIPSSAIVHPKKTAWYKGNLHTHTWWSDGDSPPEMAIQWYADHAYDFVLMTDHNTLMEGEHWFFPYDADRKRAAQLYEKNFGASVQKREHDGNFHYRLKTMAELRERFERPGRFALLQGEEITDHFGNVPVHLNGFNLVHVVHPQGGASVREILQKNLQAVEAQKKSTGQRMLVSINHPNFGWALLPEDIAPLEEARFFELFNGHQGTANYGYHHEARLSTERLWDIVLSQRLSKLHLPLIYGIAADDAHMYVDFPKMANPGRAWVMVFSESLAAEDLGKALEAGAFYASTGVILKQVDFVNGVLRVEIEPKEGVSYTTRFIGTLKGEEAKKDKIGDVLSEQTGLEASYQLSGKELYVRAKVLSTALHPNPFKEGDVEVAWVQPVVALNQ